MSSHDLIDQGQEATQSREAARLFVDTGTHADAAARPKGALGKHAVTLVVVVIGGGVIYGMRVMGMGAGAASAETSVKYEPAEGDRVEQKRFEQAISRLEMSGRPVQLSEGVGEHVFWPPAVAEAEPEAPAGPDPNLASRRAAEEARLAYERRSAELERLAAQLRVQAIMQGSVAVARINGTPVRAGNRLGAFTVVEVGESDVTVEAEGRTFRLALERDRR